MAEFMAGPGKRMIAALIGVICVALNKKFGLEISEAGQAEIATLVCVFIAQSKWGEVAHAKLEASGEVLK
jgi:hypothetical protein